MSTVEFDRYVESVNQLAILRKNVEAASPPGDPPTPPPEPTTAVSPKSAKAALKRTPAAASSAISKPLAARPPMRAAKPGTLRGEIHEILRSGGKPLRRAEIITAVAERRGQAVDEILTAKVGEIVRNPHDPFLRRVSHGVYAFHHGQN